MTTANKSHVFLRDTRALLVADKNKAGSINVPLGIGLRPVQFPGTDTQGFYQL